ncbi:MAG: hypothetical protein HN919_13875 [Verrucomicrobia bacterium]|jgi:hypothetical protein|nr:hypothetical protein [Verrucomicrobiota bacterium]
MSHDVDRMMLDAIEQYGLCLRNALKVFRASEDPLWKRTQDGISMFQGLQLTHLPPKLNADIDRRFGAINAILEPYALAEGDDYHSLAPSDLVEIQDLIEGFAFDP